EPGLRRLRRPVWQPCRSRAVAGGGRPGGVQLRLGTRRAGWRPAALGERPPRRAGRLRREGDPDRERPGHLRRRERATHLPPRATRTVVAGARWRDRLPDLPGWAVRPRGRTAALNYLGARSRRRAPPQRGQ